MSSKVLTMLLMMFFLASCAGGMAGRKAAHATSEVKIDLPAPQVHFATGKDKVISKDQDLLIQNARFIKENPDVVIVLEGHCDERGSERLNMALGDRRARSVKADLIREGVLEAQLATIISYGEKQPVDPAHNEKAWKKNRRVEFIVR